MLLAWDNKLDAASVSAGSELSTLPGTNVQHPHLSRKWGTAAGVKTSYLTIDMKAAVPVSLFSVVGTNLTSAATMRLRASNADPTALAGDLYDSGVIAAGVKDGYGAIYKKLAEVNARYWRPDLTDASVPDNLLIGRVFLGPSWDIAGRQLWDWGVATLDESKLSESTGGQDHADVRPQRRVLEFALDFMTEQEAYTKAFVLARANGRVKQLIAIPDINSAYLSEQAVLGKVIASMPVIHRRFEIHLQKFTIKESL
jgi:hypothetical protein